MTDQPNGTERGVSRRSVLRTAGAGAFGLLGIAGAAEQAGATYCPKPPSYWSKNDWPDTDRITDPLSLVDPADERSVAVWKLFLGMSHEGDAGAMMARQLLAARLNFQYRSKDDPRCVDEPLQAYDGLTIRQIKIAAKDWLRASNWPKSQPGWIVDGVDGEPLWDALAAFNSRGHPDLDCNCDLVANDDGRTADRTEVVNENPPQTTGRTGEDTVADHCRRGMRSRLERYVPVRPLYTPGSDCS